MDVTMFFIPFENKMRFSKNENKKKMSFNIVFFCIKLRYFHKNSRNSSKNWYTFYEKGAE